MFTGRFTVSYSPAFTGGRSLFWKMHKPKKKKNYDGLAEMNDSIARRPALSEPEP
jgi:hypothetical protein